MAAVGIGDSDLSSETAFLTAMGVGDSGLLSGAVFLITGSTEEIVPWGLTELAAGGEADFFEAGAATMEVGRLTALFSEAASWAFFRYLAFRSSSRGKTLPVG